MARILIAWELGEDLGHVARCYQLALGLLEAGHSVILALKTTQLPGAPVRPPGLSIIRTPLIRASAPHCDMPVNYADVLRISGFQSAPDLAERLDSWLRIFASERPDLLVADHAPTAMLAARVKDIPSLSVGNGFTVPPNIEPWPSIRPWDVITEEALHEAEARLDRVVEVAQRAVGYASPLRMRDLFEAPNILDTFAELDHFGPRLGGHYVGPVVSMPEAAHVGWAGDKGPKVIAYLRPSVPGYKAILTALSQLKGDAICVSPGMPALDARQLASAHLRMHTIPIDLTWLLQQADLAVSYGNSGFSTQALLAGVPLVMRPRYIEQALFARRVEALGAGKFVSARADDGHISGLVETVLSSASHRRAARMFCDSHQAYSPIRAVNECTDIITRLVM